MATLMDKRKNKPFHLRSDGTPYEKPIPGENLMLGFIMCILVVAALLFIWGGAK